jgi:hypothetical protein
MIQIILVCSLVGLFAYALSQRRRSAPVSVLIMASSVIGSVLVMFPNIANAIAQELGVGRGADLILYVFIIIALTAIFNLHLRLRAAFEVSTKLARAIALISVRQPDNQAQSLQASTTTENPPRASRPSLPAAL